MRKMKKLTRNELKNLGGGEGQPCYCTTEHGSTFLGYTTYDGCYYACTKNLDNQPK